MAVYSEKQAIADKVKEQLEWDDRVLSVKIFIEVFDGTVKLSGEVPTYASRLAAEDDAFSISGVRNVENNLRVKNPQSVIIPDDNKIKSFIKNMVRIDPRIDNETIDVNVEGGVVTLNGTVNAHWKKEQTENYAHRVTGVNNVINNIEVRINVELSDQQIKEEIINAVKRNTLMQAEDIRVDVKNGQVILTGFVPSYTAKIKARQIASYTFGVTNVINHLELW